jgi:predicted transcriptional regulator
MPTLKSTQVYLDPTDYKRLSRLAVILRKQETHRVTVSELIRRAIREYLDRQTKKEEK